jgi:hypothetical protein
MTKVLKGNNRHSHDPRKLACSSTKGVVQFEFILQGQKDNQVYYVEILKQLREAMYKKGPELWPND